MSFKVSFNQHRHGGKRGKGKMGKKRENNTKSIVFGVSKINNDLVDAI